MMWFEGPEGFKRKLKLVKEKWNVSLDFKVKKEIIRETYNLYTNENKNMKERAAANPNYKKRIKIRGEREAMNPYMQKLQDCLQEADFKTFESIFINT